MRIALTINKEELVAKGQEIYQHLKEKLEPGHNGQIVAIEVESGDYFLGQSVVEAGKKARKKHPDKFFYFVKVGFPAVHIRR